MSLNSHYKSLTSGISAGTETLSLPSSPGVWPWLNWASEALGLPAAPPREGPPGLQAAALPLAVGESP